MLTKSDLGEIQQIVQSVVKSSENRLNKKIEKLDRKLSYAINFLDRDYLKLLDRVERIEKHLNIEPSTL